MLGEINQSQCDQFSMPPFLGGHCTFPLIEGIVCRKMLTRSWKIGSKAHRIVGTHKQLRLANSGFRGTAVPEVSSQECIVYCKRN